MKALKTVLLGIAFILTGVGLLAIPDTPGALLYLGFFLMLIGLIIAIAGARKKDVPEDIDKK